MADELVTVATFEFLPLAEAARAQLIAEGIPAFLSDAETVYMAWWLGNALGYIKLLVPEAQAQRARGILDEAQENGTQAQDREQVQTEPVAGDADFPTQHFAPSPDDSPDAREKYESLESERPHDTQEDSVDEKSPTTMDTFRSLKKPVLFIFLAPYFAMFGLLILALLTWLFIP
jgi:Putative prokaryotic signal transducing protein